jgi:hypothetical protein
VKLKGFVGPSYNLKSVNVDCQRSVNLYPEIIESGTGKNDSVVYLKSTPGLELLVEVGAGPIRCIHQDLNGTVLVVSGNELYRLNLVMGVWTPTNLTTDEMSEFLTSTGPVRAASIMEPFYNEEYSVNVNNYFTVFVDGSEENYMYQYYLQDGAPIGPYPFEQFAQYSAVGYPSVENATHVDIIDGYLVFNQTGSGKFFVSDLNSLFVPALNFAAAEGNSDSVVGLIGNRRDLWLLGERSIELFVNTGNADFPFERAGGGFIEKGCLAPYSIAKGDGAIFWLGRDDNGQGVVYIGQSLTPQRISTHAVEYAISTYENPENATAFTYQMGGHLFYVINFTEGTWVFDASTQLWHERAFTNSGVLERHRADCHAFLNGIHFLGDYSNNKVYQYSENYYLDDETQITRLRTFPHFGNLKYLYCNSFQLDMETGVGLDGSVQGSDPQVMFDWSDDGGHTWSSELWAAIGGKIGAIGDYKKRVIWRRLGKFRDRVLRIKITDPIPVTLIDADIDVVQGAS